MSLDSYNSLGGFSVGIPSVQIIDANGNVYANSFFYSNGAPFGQEAAGSNAQVQFNSNGRLGASSALTFNNSTNRLTVENLQVTNLTNLGYVGNITITGGLPGYFLQTDGNGVLNWAAGGGGGGNGSPGGANTFVQYNDNGTFGGDSGFTYNEVTNLLTVENISTTNLSATGNISAGYLVGNGKYITGLQLDLANYVVQPNQANITSVGTLVGLDLSGNLTSTADISTTATMIAGNITVAKNISASSASFTNGITTTNVTVNTAGTLRSTGNVNFSGAQRINLGTVANIAISGGDNGYVLSTDGTGNLSWVVAGGGGGNGTPGGSNSQIQFNKNGDFGGSPYLTFDDYTHTVQIGGNLIANTFQMGAGVYKWSSSRVYFAATTSNLPNQVLFTIPVADISGVEFEIIATSPSLGARQSCKISSMYYSGAVQFTEFASLLVNGGVGNFEVDYNAGNIITAPALELKVSPATSYQVTYKMLITVFSD